MNEFLSKYFTIESLEDNNTVTFFKESNSPNNTFYYSTDNGANWTSSSSTTSWTLNTGDKVLLRAIANTWCTYTDNFWRWSFYSTGEYDVYGNIMSLLYGDYFTASFSTETNLNKGETIYNYIFCNLFSNSSKLKHAHNLLLPATTLAPYCYALMFYNCSSLVTTPVLPASNLTLRCYYQMFRGCTSLTTAPILAAPTLVQACYSEMFLNCSNLNKVICLATDISAINCTSYWLYGVSQTGNFYKDPAMSSWGSGVSGIPTGWNTIDYGYEKLLTYVDDIRYIDELQKMYKGIYLADRIYMENMIIRGVNVEDHHDYSQDYFSMEFYEDGQVQIDMGVNGYSEANVLRSADISYSKNGGAWNTISITGGNTGSINVLAGDIVRLKSTNFWDRGYNTSTEKDTFSHIRGTGKWRAFGNIESMFTGDNFIANNGTGRELKELFREGGSDIYIYVDYAGPYTTPEDVDDNFTHGLVDAKDLVFTLAESVKDQQAYKMTISGALELYTYTTYPGQGMFKNCMQLQTAPDPKNVHMPRNLVRCLLSTFFYCTRLKACDWTIDGYNIDCSGMFWYCISLKRAPKYIRSWTLVNDEPILVRVKDTEIYCGDMTSKGGATNSPGGFTNMFGCCINLVSAPVLIGSFRKGNGGTCQMFFRCYRLKFIRLYHCHWKKTDNVWSLYNGTDQYVGSDPFGLTSESSCGYKFYAGKLIVHSNISPSSWNNWANSDREIKVINDLSMVEIIERYLR